MSDYFHILVDQLHEHHMLRDPPYVHGLLTGFATTPHPDLVLAIYQHFYGDLDDVFDTDYPFDLPDDEPLPMPRYAEEWLAGLDEEGLLALVTGDHDRLPLEVVHACASRADTMVPLLHRHLMTDTHWGVGASTGDWWGLLHAVFILGLIPGEASASALLDGFRRIAFDSNNNLADWVAGYWPALCRNKTEYTTVPMRQIAEDGELYWYPRSHAVQCVLADASEGEPARLEEAIDWLAALCADASQNPEFLILAAHSLLDHPRERHRQLMEDLVDLQDPGSWLWNSFNRKDIDRAFARGVKPDWKRFENPWQFYDPDEIRRRQDRWLREDREREERQYSLYDREPVKTYRREQPRIGRNDPCPCGSGKKYKKCCLNKLH